MAIVAGYTKQSNGEYVVIGSYDSPSLAEDAVESDASSDVEQYWIASFVNAETNEPDVLGCIDV